MSGKLANSRIRLLLVVLAAVLGLALARTAWLQTVRAADLSSRAASQQRETITIPAGRGTIFDRMGVQLALGEEATTVYADPHDVRNAKAVALAAQKTLGVSANGLYPQLLRKRNRFLYVERKADPARASALEKRGLAGLGFYPEERRVYPQHGVAAQVLGYAGVDNRGLTGLELALDRVLAGRPGRETFVKDPFGQPLNVLRSVPERDGHDVFLTLDHTIQANAEAVLRQTIARWHAKGATAIVLDPRTGDILAMSAAPNYDANRAGAVPTSARPSSS
jgi:cell division protein FtsI/penicillin-binding protein 2